MICDYLFILLKTIICIPVIFFVPGFLVNSIIYPDKSFKLDSNCLLNIYVSIIITSFIGLLLAQLGIFSLFNIVLILFLISITLYFRFKQLNLELKFSPSITFSIEKILFIILIISAIFLFFQPYQWIAGERDPGVYVSTGINIAKTGSIFIKDPLLAQMNTSIQETLYDIEPASIYGFISWEMVNFKYQLPGFFITDLNSGTITPQFLHIFPVWIAIFYSIFGLLGVFYVNPIFGVLSIISLFFIGKRLFSWKVGALAGFLLILNFAQIWYGRYPLSEIISQFFILSGIATFIQFNRRNDRYLAVICALLFGLAFLTKIETILIIVPLGLYLIYIKLCKNLNTSHYYFILSIFIMLIYNLIDYFLFSRPYLSLLLESAINPPPMAPDLSKYIGLFVSIEMFSWYMTKLGLILAIAGFVLIILKKDKKEKLLIVLIALIFSTLLISKLTIFPDQPWWARRLIPVVFPLYALFASYSLNEIAEIKKIGRYISCILTTFLIVSLTIISYPIINHSEGYGMVKGISGLSEYFGDNDIILTGSSLEGYVLSTPLYYIFDKKTIFLFRYDLVPSLGNRQLIQPENVSIGVEYLLNHGYDIYFVTQSHIYIEKILYHLATTHRIDFIDTYNFSYKHLESTFDRLPTEGDKKDIQMNLNIYRISINKSIMIYNSNLSIDIGSPSDVIYLESGFYDREKWGAVNNRWISGNASIRIPTPERNNLSISIRAGDFRPAGVPSSNISIYFNNNVIGNFTTTEGYELYNMTVDKDLLTHPYSTLRIVMSTWKPSDIKGTADTRDLGINIDKIFIEQKLN